MAAILTPGSDAHHAAYSASLRDLAEELVRRKALKDFKTFVKTFPPAKPYKWGRHTNVMCEELQRATEVVEAGGRAYIIITIPPRHGKSDVCSRRWPLWHRLRNPDHDAIDASYGFDIASEMSFDARALAERVCPLYGLRVAEGRSALQSWRFAEHAGAFHAVGIGGAITGKGAHILVIDDYFKNREEAESELVRDKRWHSLQSDLLTRLAPAHAVVIVANRWHEDDIVGRILRVNDPGSDVYDELFPKFKIITFPAWTQERGWLFPERFSESWYIAQRSFMGSYAWESQAQQEPKPRQGNLLRADLVTFLAPEEFLSRTQGLRFNRGWDLARTEKERTKDEPDYTAGTLAHYAKKSDSLFIKDVVRLQASTLNRDERIRRVAKTDTKGTRVRVETGPDSRDACLYVQRLLRGIASVIGVIPLGDRVVRATPLEPIFEGGRAYAMKAPWNDDWKNELLSFPGGRKDDQVASLCIAVASELCGRLTASGMVLV